MMVRQAISTGPVGVLRLRAGRGRRRRRHGRRKLSVVQPAALKRSSWSVESDSDGRAVDGDVVVVPQHDQVVELEMAGQRDRFVADAFHQIAVAGDDIGLVVDQIVAEAGIEDALGQRHAHGIGDALAQGAGGGLDAGQMAIFGMAGAWGCRLCGSVLMSRCVMPG